MNSDKAGLVFCSDAGESFKEADIHHRTIALSFLNASALEGWDLKLRQGPGILAEQKAKGTVSGLSFSAGTIFSVLELAKSQVFGLKFKELLEKECLPCSM